MQSTLNKKVSVSAWITEDQKKEFRKEAYKNGWTTSAYLENIITAILEEAREENEKEEPSFEIVAGTKEETLKKISVRFSPEEIRALDTFSDAHGQSRQKAIVQAVRSMLLKREIVSQKDRKLIVDSTKEINRIGVNLNQITKILNETHRSGTEGVNSAALIKMIESIDKRLSTHIKVVDTFLENFSGRPKIRKKN